MPPYGWAGANQDPSQAIVIPTYRYLHQITYLDTLYENACVAQIFPGVQAFWGTTHLVVNEGELTMAAAA